VTGEPAYEWRGGFTNTELNELHAQGFDHERLEYDWRRQVERHSLGWVCARQPAGRQLVGFVNVAWDGGSHAFLLDTLVPAAQQRRGIGRRLVAVAAEHSRAAGCQWLHVDFEEHLRSFYFGACGFDPTNAGLADLT
jgi:GNAT superfamily N-acetyltransferase